VAHTSGGAVLILQGRGISRGRASGELLVLNKPFSFLGGVDPKTGELSTTSGLASANITGKVFAFPRGRGSTVGSYTILQMRKEMTAPAGIVNEKAETIVATGAVMAGVPMIDSVDLSLLRTGDRVAMDGDLGTIELIGVAETHVVTCILRHQGKILALKRSDKVGTYQGSWAGVSGFVEKDEIPRQTAFKEIREETGILEPKLIREAAPIPIRDRQRVWFVHPFLFEVGDMEVRIDWEHTEYRWIDPKEAEHLSAVPGYLRVLRALL